MSEGTPEKPHTESGVQRAADQQDNVDQPDVLLDVPLLKVDEIHLEVDSLRAHVSVLAEILSLLRLQVGVDATLQKVSLDIKGVEAVAVLKARLDNVAAIIDRVMTTIDDHPEIIGELASGLGGALGGRGQRLGEALQGAGEGAGSAVPSAGGEVGHAAGEGRGAAEAGGAAGDNGLGRVAGGTGGSTGTGRQPTARPLPDEASRGRGDQRSAEAQDDR
jgi:hypothetical protein